MQKSRAQTTATCTEDYKVQPSYGMWSAGGGVRSVENWTGAGQAGLCEAVVWASSLKGF